MKQIWPNYSYSPTTNVLTLTGLNIDRDQLLLVSAPERGRIMYNFADSTVTASAFTAGANTGLTLVASTAGLTTTAALVIYYDDQVAGISGTVTANIVGLDSDSGLTNVNVPILAYDIAVESATFSYTIPVQITNIDGVISSANRLPVYGTVTAMAGTNFRTAIQDGILDYVSSENFPVNISSPLPSGTNRIGVVTIGAGTVTIGAGTAQIGSVTASLAISSSAITSGVFSSLTSATLVPGNVARKMATVYNLGAGQLFVNAGASATTLGGGFMVALSSGDFYECDYTTTTLSAIFATAGTASWVSH